MRITTPGNHNLLLKEMRKTDERDPVCKDMITFHCRIETPSRRAKTAYDPPMIRSSTTSPAVWHLVNRRNRELCPTFAMAATLSDTQPEVEDCYASQHYDSSLPQKPKKTQELFLLLQNEWENLSISFAEHRKWRTRLKKKNMDHVLSRIFLTGWTRSWTTTIAWKTLRKYPRKNLRLV